MIGRFFTSLYKDEDSKRIDTLIEMCDTSNAILKNEAPPTDQLKSAAQASHCPGLFSQTTQLLSNKETEEFKKCACKK